MMIGSHLIKSGSSTQPIIALSSGEAELYALVKGASQATGLMSMLADYRIPVSAKVCVDSTAALGITHRVGLGKTRHISTQYLWVQEKVYNGELEVQKVGTHENPADLLTKYVKAELIARHLESLHGRLEDHRANTALRVNNIFVKDSWLTRGSSGNGTWTRVHNTPRFCLFTPMKVARGPGRGDEVGDVRVTHGRYDDGEAFVIEDDWRRSGAPHRRLARHWTGFTSFKSASSQ